MPFVDHETVRHQWVWDQLSRVPEGAEILDAGCGTQLYRPACSHLKYTAQDFAQYDGTGDGAFLQSEGFEYGKVDVVSDIWDMPVPDASFDAVLCTEVIEHVPYAEKTVRELVRVLRPGGTLILTAPFASMPHMTPYFFYSGFHRTFYERHLGEAGCDCVDVTANGNAWEMTIQELLRLRQAVPNPVARFGYLALVLPAIAALKIASRLWSAAGDYCPFGYMIVARKQAA